MHLYGFSTGALAFGDFRRALDLLLAHDVKAVELSALRDHELPALMRALPYVDTSRYEYVSVHAPSRFTTLSEAEAARLLSPCLERRLPIVLHPDAIADTSAWDRFGELLCIENMDKRKSNGRTPEELQPWFERFPDATFCFDLGHTRQVDPSLTMAHEFISEFGHRLRQIHLSELNSQSKHEPLSAATVLAIQDLALRLPRTAVILESVVQEPQIGLELEMAKAALEPSADPEAKARGIPAPVTMGSP